MLSLDLKPSFLFGLVKKTKRAKVFLSKPIENIAKSFSVERTKTFELSPQFSRRERHIKHGSDLYLLWRKNATQTLQEEQKG